VFRTFLIIGAAIDLLLALFLLLVFGYVLDSWHDPKGAWVGWVVTALWLVAFALSAGAPLLGYVLNRRRAAPGRISLVIWLPAIVLIGVTVVGFVVFPL
jgi:hypothetical protein